MSCITVVIDAYIHFQFFGLLGFSNTASSMIGPNVIQVIISRTGNNWKGFPLLFALSAAASLVIWFGVDVTKGRRDAGAWADSQRSKDLEIDAAGEGAKS